MKRLKHFICWHTYQFTTVVLVVINVIITTSLYFLNFPEVVVVGSMVPLVIISFFGIGAGIVDDSVQSYNRKEYNASLRELNN